MSSRITRLSAAALILMTGLTIIYQLRGTLDPAGVAWSQIAEKIQDIDICRFSLAHPVFML